MSQKNALLEHDAAFLHQAVQAQPDPRLLAALGLRLLGGGTLHNALKVRFFLGHPVDQMQASKTKELARLTYYSALQADLDTAELVCLCNYAKHAAGTTFPYQNTNCIHVMAINLVIRPKLQILCNRLGPFTLMQSLFLRANCQCLQN